MNKRRTPLMMLQMKQTYRPMATDRFRLASIEITQRCNGSCPYCTRTRSDLDMPVSDFDLIIDRLMEEGIEAVALGGGEPTLHPWLSRLLGAARDRGLRAGLTTNSRAPALVRDLAKACLLDSFGVSAGKGAWLDLVRHPRAAVNLLLVRGGLRTVLEQAVIAIRHGAHCLLLLGFKGDHSVFSPAKSEVADAYSLLTMLGAKTGITIAADDYTRRRLGLSEACGEGFVRINIDGVRDVCCFPNCEFRAERTRAQSRVGGPSPFDLKSV